MEILLWQSQEIECPMLEKTHAVPITRKNLKTRWLARIALNRASRTEFVLIVVSMLDER
jgi:hypothetical protein